MSPCFIPFVKPFPKVYSKVLPLCFFIKIFGESCQLGKQTTEISIVIHSD